MGDRGRPADQRLVKVSDRPLPLPAMIPGGRVVQDLQQRRVSGDPAQSAGKLPVAGEPADIAICLGELQPAVEERDRHVRLNSQRHMQDGQAVLATGKRHIAVVSGQVLADPGKDHRLVMGRAAQRKKPLVVQAGRAVAGGVPSRSPATVHPDHRSSPFTLAATPAACTAWHNRPASGEPRRWQ
jgi:hypothetical protein